MLPVPVVLLRVSVCACTRKWLRLQAGTGVSSIVDPGTHEVQTVSTCTDVGYPVTSGTVMLAFSQVPCAALSREVPAVCVTARVFIRGCCHLAGR